METALRYSESEVLKGQRRVISGAGDAGLSGEMKMLGQVVAHLVGQGDKVEFLRIEGLMDDGGRKLIIIIKRGGNEGDF